MQIQEHIPVGSKTTMRIGGTARYYADLLTRQDIEAAVAFAQEKRVPLIILGGGSNTIFADGEVEALVVRIKAEAVTFPDGSGSSDPRPQAGMSGPRTLVVQSGKILASLINECAQDGLDLSTLAGIPGTIGGAIFGNAGQGPKGTWLDSSIVDVTAFVDGKWKTFTKEECVFRYRESVFKDMRRKTPLIWQATLYTPSGDPATIKNTVEALLKKRFETQPHLKTAGSCFKAVGATPAWQLIAGAGLRGVRIGDVELSAKHANFLMNIGRGTFADAKQIVERVKAEVPEHLEVEMRFIERDGSLAF